MASFVFKHSMYANSWEDMEVSMERGTSKPIAQIGC